VEKRVINEAPSLCISMSLTIYVPLSSFTLGAYVFLETSLYFLCTVLSPLYMAAAGNLYTRILQFQLQSPTETFLRLDIHFHESIGEEELIIF